MNESARRLVPNGCSPGAARVERGGLAGMSGRGRAAAVARERWTGPLWWLGALVGRLNPPTSGLGGGGLPALAVSGQAEDRQAGEVDGGSVQGEVC